MFLYISFELKVFFSEEIIDIVLLEPTSEYKCFGDKRYWKLKKLMFNN